MAGLVEPLDELWPRNGRPRLVHVMPWDLTVGGAQRMLDALTDAWAEIADRQTANGDAFVYANEEPVRRLLQDLLDKPPNMAPNRAWFAAARSMRDTEPVALLKLRFPDPKQSDR